MEPVFSADFQIIENYAAQKYQETSTLLQHLEILGKEGIEIAVVGFPFSGKTSTIRSLIGEEHTAQFHHLSPCITVHNYTIRDVRINAFEITLPTLRSLDDAKRVAREFKEQTLWQKKFHLMIYVMPFWTTGPSHPSRAIPLEDRHRIVLATKLLPDVWSNALVVFTYANQPQTTGHDAFSLTPPQRPRLGRMCTEFERIVEAVGVPAPKLRFVLVDHSHPYLDADADPLRAPPPASTPATNPLQHLFHDPQALFSPARTPPPQPPRAFPGGSEALASVLQDPLPVSATPVLRAGPEAAPPSEAFASIHLDPLPPDGPGALHLGPGPARPLRLDCDPHLRVAPSAPPPPEPSASPSPLAGSPFVLASPGGAITPTTPIAAPRPWQHELWITAIECLDPAQTLAFLRAQLPADLDALLRGTADDIARADAVDAEPRALARPRRARSHSPAAASPSPSSSPSPSPGPPKSASSSPAAVGPAAPHIHTPSGTPPAKDASAPEAERPTDFARIVRAIGRGIATACSIAAVATGTGLLVPSLSAIATGLTALAEGRGSWSILYTLATSAVGSYLGISRVVGLVHLAHTLSSPVSRALGYLRSAIVRGFCSLVSLLASAFRTRPDTDSSETLEGEAEGGYITVPPGAVHATPVIASETAPLDPQLPTPIPVPAPTPAHPAHAPPAAHTHIGPTEVPTPPIEATCATPMAPATAAPIEPSTAPATPPNREDAPAPPPAEARDSDAPRGKTRRRRTEAVLEGT